LTGAKVLVPGCGTGSDAIELAKLGAKVLAADWSEVAIGSLKARFAKVSDEGCVKGDLECLKGDLFGFEPTPVDLVCEHTFFCAIDPAIRAQYVSTMARWIRPGGYLFGNFFILSEADAASLPGLAMGRDGKGPPFASTLREIEALFSASFEKVVLRPSSAPDPKRRPGMEWVGIFRRKGES
jgi:thiopurine S-methyltransferase